MTAAASGRLDSGASIRVRMALVLAIVLAPMILLALHLAIGQRAAEREHLEARAMSIANALALQPAQMMRQAREQMARIARDAEAAGAGQCAEVLRSVAEPLLVQNLFIVDRAGGITCALKPPPAPISVADREYFRRTIAERRFQTSGPLQGRVSNRWVIALSQPFAEGAVVGSLDLAWFQDLVAALPLEDDTLVSIVDDEGRLVARRPHVAEYVGRPIQEAAAFAEARRTSPVGRSLVQTLDGIARIVAYSAVPGTRLTLRVGIAASRADQAAWEVMAKSLTAMLLAAIIALSIGWVAFRGLITGPVRALTRAAARLGAGDLHSRTGIPPDTPVVGGLAEKFDELAAHGERVSRALRTLSAGNRTLLRERDEQSLLDSMCKVAVEQGGYPAAYVCYARHDERKSIDVMATAGADRGFLRSVNMTWADTETGRGSVGRCLRSGERVVLRSILEDSGAAPFHAAARAHGFESMISLPLRVQGTLVGTFTLAAPEKDAFDADEVALLDEMAADLSFGIDVIRAEGRRREAERIARRALTHDTEANLPNRTAFIERVRECIGRGRGNHEPVTVMDIHLGGLQDVYDSFGYRHGAEVLRQVAERLKRLPGAEHDLGRLPSDDFGYVLCGHDAAGAARVADAVLKVFEEPARIGDALVDVRACVGVSFYPGHGDDPEMLVRRASIAAREGFRRELPYCVYSGATAREDPARLALAAELRTAIETRQLLLNFQPKVRVQDGRVVGSEALVRWRHPGRGLVPPAEFVPLAEEIGLIRPMTYQILDLAVRHQHAWRDGGVAAGPVAVNLSARNLYDPNLLKALDNVFGTWGVPRNAIEFEITEGALVDDPEKARQVLARLRDGGAKIYIDDFGTGYSSLSYLVALPVHALKIDRSFIRQMSRSTQARSVVASIISMAHGLGLRVVAEGVETAEDAAELARMGCDEAQGYYYAKPMRGEDFAAWGQASAPR